MMWISLDDVTEAQSNTVKESQNLFCFYSCGYCMAEIMLPSRKSEEAKFVRGLFVPIFEKNSHTYKVHMCICIYMNE